MKTLATVGYEHATVPVFLTTLEAAGVDLLVDVRAAARSRRLGFAKTRLAENLATIGIPYLHLPGLGTPAEGRAAARAGDHAGMHVVFREHLATDAAQADLERLIELIGSHRKVCILCLEADPAHCHRSLVAEAAAARIPLRIEHLTMEEED